MTDDMPVFVLKAKDMLALRTVAAYHTYCVEAEQYAQAEEVWKALVEMRNWQVRNELKMKFPDHEHVPVRESNA